MISYRFIHYQTILRFIGIVNIILSVLMLIPAIYSFLNNDKSFEALIISIIFSLAISSTLYLAGEGNIRELNKRDGFITVVGTWLISTLTCSLPFFFTGSTRTFGDAIFESIAGFATNGLSLLKFNEIPYSILLWRGILDWIGGVGIIILVISFFPFFKSGQDKVFLYDKSDESIGKISASTSAISRRIVTICLLVTFILFAILMIQGLDLENAILYSLSTISSSGFSTLNGNVSSLPNNILTTIGIFMIIAGSNFYLIYHALKLHFKKIFLNNELKWYLASMLIPLCILTAYYINFNGFINIREFVTTTTFNIISIISTTGFFITQDTINTNHFWWIIIFFLMFLGSASASSGGGLNVFRQAVLIKSSRLYFAKILHPKAVNKITFNKDPIEEKTISNVMGFFLIFILVYIVGFLSLTLLDYSFKDSLALSISFLSNTGNAVRLLIPNIDLADIGLIEKFTFSAMMIFGRLQIIPILAILSPSFWRK